MRLDSITRPLVQSVENKAFKFSFTIVEDGTMNAFALPGGAVVIHTELLEAADNAEEVAGVLAHEISHVTRRHHIRGIIGNLGIFFIIRALLGDVAGLSGDIATAGATLSSLKYSRGFETEADDEGYSLLLKAHIKPDGMIHFFEKLKKENPDAGMMDFLSTHPATSDRIENLNKKEKPNGPIQNIQMDYSKFKTDIQTAIQKKS